MDTDKGPVEIPTNLQTIVSDYYLGEFLAVDVKPVIASPYALNNPFLAGLCDGIEALNTTSAETSLEMIAEKQPDLIVTITEADYDKYAKIAPTVYIADGTRTDEDLFRYIADLVGKKDAAEAYIAEFNDKVATVKDEIVGIVGGRTVSILEVWPQEIYTMGSHFARGGSILYDMWGLKAPEAIQGPMVEGDEAYKVISVEALPDYAGRLHLLRRAGRRGLGLRGRLATVEELARRAGRSPHALRAGGLHAPRPHHAHQPA